MFGVNAGGQTTVTLYLPAGTTVDTYYKYGPTPADPTPHWYEFLFDGMTGAEINGNVIVLHFTDGQRGDDDLSATGNISDDGAPASPRAVIPPGDDNGDKDSDGDVDDDGDGGGPCFIATAAYGTPLHADLKTLRDFRDKYLLPTAPGQALVRWYYQNSPPMARYLAEHESPRTMARAILATIVYVIRYPASVAIVFIFVLLLMTRYKMHRKGICRPAR